MIQSILSNLAIILLGHLVMSILMEKRKYLSDRLLSICIVTLFSGVIITMFYLPINIDGYKFDLRIIPLIFLAMFRGWKITIATLIVVCTWRYLMGGVGTLPGIFAGMIGPTFFVLLYFAFKKGVAKIYEQVFVLTVCWLISDFPIVFIIPNGWEVFKGFVVIRYTSFLIVAFTYFAFVRAEYSKAYYKEQLEQLAWYDQLTNLLNRRKFLELIEAEQIQCKSNQFIALIDIDHFKKINDTYGHLVGDEVLAKLAAIFEEYKKSTMQFARYGGEEFIVHLKESSMEEAKRVLEELRQIVRTTKFYVDDLEIHFSISIGIAQIDKNTTLKETIHLADQRLYLAKEHGRDQIIANSDIELVY